MMIVWLRPGQCLELIDDRLYVGMGVAFGEHGGKEMCHRRRPKRRAQILERVAPTIADALLPVGCDAMFRELPARVVPGAREHQRGGPLRLLVMHPGRQRRADRASDQDGALA